MMGVSATANKRQEPPSSETVEAEEISSGIKDLTVNNSDSPESIQESQSSGEETEEDDKSLDNDESPDSDEGSDNEGTEDEPLDTSTSSPEKQATKPVLPVTPVIEASKPKFVFGSAAKSLVTFNTVAKSESKADFSTEAPKKDGLEEDSPFNTEKTDADVLHNLPQATGEEGEAMKFSGRAKLYEFDAVNKEWKDRGLGILKINEDFETGAGRMLMRAEGVLRVLLNVRLFSGMTYAPVPDRSVRFVALVDSKPVQYLLRLRSSDDANALLLELAIFCDPIEEETALHE
ncbi:Ran-specific GTPase-activating protein 2 [Paramicrosporidium saccamoebae]|uniref:Ran-specific GTPase-activating protein 2 n=1 Tax=Paramicrosporidium saccamoebae TaxID=1246581 RepID=A0A2H9TLN7_9FUNG|nr:Ran-specific GTPase-activating protein 2 [Paramicrosporidium saccamoebae]